MTDYEDMPLIGQLDMDIQNNYSSDAFRNAVEDHLQILKQSPATQTLSGQPIDAIVYEGDLYGIFAKLGIEKRLRWATMRLNGYTGPHEYTGDNVTFLVPSVDQLDRLAATVASRTALQV